MISSSHLKKLMNKVQHKFGIDVIIFEGAIVHDTCQIGPFTIIYPGVTIEENVVIGSSCILGKKPTTGVNQLKLVELSEITLIRKKSLICDQVILYTGCDIGEECYLADRAFLRENVQLENKVVIGTSVTVSFNAYIGSTTKIMTGTNIGGKMRIGENCFIGAHVCSVNDNNPRINSSRNEHQGAIIEDNVVIGSNVTILPHLLIKKGITVAAGAVISKNLTEENGLYVGIPAKLKNRNT
jgi:UDP-3-O-[3-hydroxymyristoyl] glucosamine N-acyltransferase